MGNFEPEIQIFITTGITGYFGLLFCGNTELDLRPFLFEERYNDLIHAVIMEGKISDLLSGGGFQEQAMISDSCRVKWSPGWQYGGLQR